MMQILAVGLGGALGAMLRYLISLMLPYQEGFPIATFTVNLIGSFALAFLLSKQNLFKHTYMKLALTTGLLGAFTTFSTFSYETFTLLAAGEFIIAGSYVGSSLLGGLLFSFAGFVMAKGRDLT